MKSNIFKIIFFMIFLTLLVNNSYSGECIYCKKDNPYSYRDWTCFKCQKALTNILLTIQGNNLSVQDYDNEIEIAESPYSIYSMSTSAAAVSPVPEALGSALMAIASAQPYSLGVNSKLSVRITHSLLSSLRPFTQEKALQPNGPGITVYGDFSNSALLSAAILEQHLEEVLAPLISGMTMMANGDYRGPNTASWRDMLADAYREAASNTVFYWININQSWFFLSIPPDREGEKITMVIWNHSTKTEGRSTHYCLIDFDNIRTVSDVLDKILGGNSHSKSGYFQLKD
jgi:hypothetical protein